MMILTQTQFLCPLQNSVSSAYPFKLISYGTYSDGLLTVPKNNLPWNIPFNHLKLISGQIHSLWQACIFITHLKHCAQKNKRQYLLLGSQNNMHPFPHLINQQTFIEWLYFAKHCTWQQRITVTINHDPCSEVVHGLARDSEKSRDDYRTVC